MSIAINLITIIIVAIAFHIAIQPNELLAPYAKYIYQSKLPTLLKKLLVCPYCLSFWTSMVYVLYIGEHVVYSFGVFIVVYLITKQIK
jgi:hypothetical protein